VRIASLLNVRGQPEWAWLWRASRPFLALQVASLVCVLLSSAIGLTAPLVMRWLIDDVLPGKRWGALAVASAIFLSASMVRSALSSLGSLCTTIASTRMALRLRARAVKKVMSLSPALHARHAVGDLLQRLERDLAIVGDAGSEAFPAIARLLGETLMAVAVMCYLDWRLSAIVLPLLPLFAYVRHRCRGLLRGGAEAVREAHARQSDLLQEMLNGVLQVQLLGAEHRVSRRYARLNLQTAHTEIAQRRNELAFAFLSMSLIGLGVAVIVEYGGARVMLGGLTVGGLVAFYGYIGSILTPMGTVVSLYAQLIRVQVSIRRSMEIEQLHDTIQEAPDARPLSGVPQSLVCRDVTLSYGRDADVLRRIQFRAVAGERVAVVGRSGSGKSSLLKLFPRLYEAGEGHVLIDGCDVRSLQLRSLRDAIGFVPQEPALFQGTMRENVRYGSPAATADEIDQAAWIACLPDVIARLPRGWDTSLGPMGSGLSGGERQRLAIARAVLQRRPILILDEASSALDPLTERLLLSRLEGWAADRIVIVVSHRLAAAQWADRVVVMNQGEIVEDSCHDLLYRADTQYGALWAVPASTPAG
jgi:ABC-type multidrug transport system fused ATPase/permease subunit